MLVAVTAPPTAHAAVSLGVRLGRPIADIGATVNQARPEEPEPRRAAPPPPAASLRPRPCSRVETRPRLPVRPSGPAAD
jgi:hypothetical protein